MLIRCSKKLIMSTFLVYAFNMVAVNFNVVIPINLWTVGFTAVFEVPALVIFLILQTIGV